MLKNVFLHNQVAKIFHQLLNIRRSGRLTPDQVIDPAQVAAIFYGKFPIVWVLIELKTGWKPVLVIRALIWIP